MKTGGSGVSCAIERAKLRNAASLFRKDSDTKQRAKNCRLEKSPCRKPARRFRTTKTYGGTSPYLVGSSTNGSKAELTDIVAKPSVNNHATILNMALAAGKNELRYNETIAKRLAPRAQTLRRLSQMICCSVI